MTHRLFSRNAASSRAIPVSKMYEIGAILKKDRVHLLGCQVPQEFSWYKDMPFIEAITQEQPQGSAPSRKRI